MGEDNLEGLHKWKNVESITANHNIIVYPRYPVLGNEISQNAWQDSYPMVTMVDAPRMEISATLIRTSFREGKPLKNLLPKAVFDYIEGSNIFQ